MTQKRPKMMLAAGAVALSLGTTACGGAAGSSGETVEMNVLTFAGDLGEALADIAEGFEEKNNVEINWVEGSGVQNVARVAASAGNQQYDAAFVPGQSQVLGSKKGYWAKLDPKLVDTSDVYDVLLAKNNDSVPVGLIITDLYYNTEVFEKKGWQPPTSFADLLDQQYCEQVGITDATLTYGLYTVLGLGGLTQEQAEAGELEDAWDKGVQRLSSYKGCLPTIESSSGALDQKIQTGQYVVGTQGSVRLLELADSGAPVKAVTPREGAFLTESFVAPVKDAPHPKLAQKFVAWYLRESAQKTLMTEVFYGPVISSLTVPDKLAKMGVPDKETIDQLVIPDRSAVAEHRSDWIDAYQRALA